MEEANKLPLKRVELSLSKFNEVAIPHHLDLLRQHKANIIKYSADGEHRRVRAEQANAQRVAARLRALLAELAALRRAVRRADRARFDAATQRSRDLTLRSIVDYLETPPMTGSASAAAGSAASTDSVGLVPAGSVASTDSVGLVPAAGAEPEPLLQLRLDDHELELREREAVLRGWAELQAEVRALHGAWQHVQAAALAQREPARLTAAAVDVAADNVAAARAHLSAAERLRGGVWLAGGAVAGALAGGPVGLAVGAKAGAAAALAGSLLGCLGARLLGRRRLAPASDRADPAVPADPADPAGKKDD